MLFKNFKVYSVGAPLFFVLLLTIQSGLTYDLQCLTKTGKPGKCVPSSQCESSSENSNKCGTIHHTEMVCCAVSDEDSSLLPKPPHCGLQRVDNEGSGHATSIFEFPWLARIEYDTPDHGFIFYCEASLINDRYVLTAASCVHSLPKGIKVHRVRLGEWDLDSENDCQDGSCSNAPVDIGIEQIVVHHKFDRSYRNPVHNIALVRLNQTVPFSLSVQPICLPVHSTNGEPNRNGRPTYAAGWRCTGDEFLGEKQMVEMKITSAQECGSVDETPSKFCAGKLDVYAGGLCILSIGSPLMQTLDGAWYQIGVDSVWPDCRENREIVDMYMNVTEYMDWIKQNVY